MPKPEICCHQLVEQTRALVGLGMGMGMLVCKNSELLKKVEDAEKEIRELKQRRSEDAKANEKVVSIFAAREHSWCDERKKLRLQIGGLMNELKVVEKNREESVSELELVLQLKGKLMEESDKKLREELREKAKSHETALSALEAEMGRTKQELGSVLEKKEQLILVNQRLCMEIVKMHKDLEHKDAMLRKYESKDETRNVVSKHGNDPDMRRGLVESKLMTVDLENYGAGKHKIGNEVRIDAFVEQVRQRDEKQQRKVSGSGPNHFEHRNNQLKVIANDSSDNCTWKMDNHVLGVSYKVETLLKQQLLMLENKMGVKHNGYMSLINKQLHRYQSIQRKIDHLCVRMNENNLNLKCGVKEDEMEHFLEQTFLLQRYIVSTGQKLMQVQAAKVGTSLVADAQQHIESIKELFPQVQRGLELQISRLLGDLERALTIQEKGLYI